MKTGITVLIDTQVSIDDYKVVRMTKVFDDDATILKIKTWIKEKTKSSGDVGDISLTRIEISDISE